MAPVTGSIRAHYEIEDAMEHVYDVMILGKTILTTVTKHPDAVTEWINADENTVLRHVGFEFELDYNTTRIGTVQFCDGNRCLVLQLPGDTSPCPPSLDHFLGHHNNTFVGIDIVSKKNLLRQQFPFRATVRCMDLGETAAFWYNRPELRDADMSLLAATALGVEVEKPLVEGDWSRPFKLSDEQVQFACIDAFVNLEVGRWLSRTQGN